MRASPIARTLFWTLIAVAVCAGLYLHGLIAIGFLQDDGRWALQGATPSAITVPAAAELAPA